MGFYLLTRLKTVGIFSGVGWALKNGKCLLQCPMNTSNLTYDTQSAFYSTLTLPTLCSNWACQLVFLFSQWYHNSDISWAIFRLLFLRLDPTPSTFYIYVYLHQMCIMRLSHFSRFISKITSFTGLLWSFNQDDFLLPLCSHSTKICTSSVAFLWFYLNVLLTLKSGIHSIYLCLPIA